MKEMELLEKRSQKKHEMPSGFHGDNKTHYSSEEGSFQRKGEIAAPETLRAFNGSDFQGQQQRPKKTMDFSIRGDMELQFQFDSNGQSVKISVLGDRGLEIETSNGAKFSLPLQGGGLKKVA